MCVDRTTATDYKTTGESEINLDINSDAFGRLQDFNAQAENVGESKRMQLGRGVIGGIHTLRPVKDGNEIGSITCNDYDCSKNLAIRQSFAKALTDAFSVNSLKELPKEVQKDLKTGDFKEKKDGTITSTRPLTALLHLREMK